MPSGKYTDTLKQPGLQSFLWTQFLGALNDNVHKMVVTLLAANMAISSGSGSGYLTAVAAVFMLPFFFFSGYAGHMADVFSKRNILVATKAFEILAMVLGFVSFLTERMDLMLGVVFLMGLQSTFFSPSKYGILPEMLPDKDLSRANGLLEMSTFMAIILGTSLGSLLMVLLKDRLGIVGLILIGIAVVGTVASLGIARVPPSGAHKPFRLNPWAEIGSGLKRLLTDRSLWFTVLGIAYFWFLGALIQLALILLGKEVMELDDLLVGLLVSFLAIGIALGSLAAGRLSGDKVEMGLVPLGSIGMGLCSILLYSLAPSFPQVSTALILLGFSGGLYIVPLYALVQQRSQREEKGKLLATTNFLGTLGVLLASGVFWLFRDVIQFQADKIILTFGLLTLVATVYILTILPDYLIRFILWLLTHSIYKIRIVGQDGIPFRGPALLVCNHMSHMDGILVGACVQRFIRFLIYRPYYEIWGLNRLFRLMKAIPVSGRNRTEIVQSIERAREELRQGHVVCIFAEGAISRTGNLLPFKRGFEKIVEGLDVPVIPIYLDRLWGSIFSFKEGRFLWKWPERIPYPVTVSFGPTMSSTVTADQVRHAISELGSDTIPYRRTRADQLQIRFLKTAKRRWFSFSMADSTGQELTFGKVLVGSLLLCKWIRRHCGEEPMVGLLLPASVAGALANIAVLLAGKVPVNLNFTAGREALNSAVEQCGIRTILTSRIFTAKAKIEEMDGMVRLEEVMKQVTVPQKVYTAFLAFFLPAVLIRAIYGDGERNSNSLATVLFSSGSTGKAKGVMLSHHNILANVEAMAQVFWVTKKDRIMGVLPLFHSFGFTATQWFPLIAGFGVVYHANPTDAKTIGEMVLKYQATILISTPTFYAMYIKKCSAEEFSSLRYAIVGAEKLREPVAKAFAEKYGVDLLEGYGCTEMGPVVSVNIPNVKQGVERQVGLKPGTVGHPIPGVSVKVVDPETGEEMDSGEEGLLLVKGPGRMMGYLGQAEETKKVLLDGWYVTGDIAAVDQDGFIKITDRLSRFSKIGGEMVPHIKLEETINKILGDECSVVTAIPDEQKGERLVAFYNKKEVTPEELLSKLRQSGLPNIWMPRGENLYCLDAIPLLGSGKVDLKQVKMMAIARAGN